MPRRNRKGRRRNSRPRLFHPESRREARRNQRELERFLANPPADSLVNSPSESAPVELARECGNCVEWVAPADPLAARGRCIHPASGVVAPPPDMAGCPHFTARR